jgi:hypothetical protein
MRHFFVARSIATLSRGMAASPRLTILVALPGTLDRAAPGLPRAISGAIDLAAVAAATDHDLHAAALAEKQPRRGCLGMGWLNTRWTYATIAGMLALHACPARVWGTASSQTAKFRSRRRACPSREAVLADSAAASACGPCRQTVVTQPGTRPSPNHQFQKSRTGRHIRTSDISRRIHADSGSHRQRATPRSRSGGSCHKTASTDPARSSMIKMRSSPYLTL